MDVCPNLLLYMHILRPPAVCALQLIRHAWRASLLSIRALSAVFPRTVTQQQCLRCRFRSTRGYIPYLACFITHRHSPPSLPLHLLRLFDSRGILLRYTV